MSTPKVFTVCDGCLRLMARFDVGRTVAFIALGMAVGNMAAQFVWSDNWNRMTARVAALEKRVAAIQPLQPGAQGGKSK